MQLDSHLPDWPAAVTAEAPTEFPTADNIQCDLVASLRESTFDRPALPRSLKHWLLAAQLMRPNKAQPK